MPKRMAWYRIMKDDEVLDYVKSWNMRSALKHFWRMGGRKYPSKSMVAEKVSK